MKIRIPVTLQLVVLTVGLTAVYTMVGQVVPQKEVHPPEVIEIDKSVSSAEMAQIGKKIFDGKGICVTCHTIGKSGALRFPDLDGVATRAATRRPGMSATDYLAESLYEPDTFVVEGFNPGMPVINKPPIGLTDEEILTVIAYLQTLGGEPTVTMETRFVYTGGAAPAAAPAVETTATVAATSDPLSRLGCTACHYTDRGDELAGPSLWDAGARLSHEQLVELTTFHPPTPAGQPYPTDMTVADVQQLVAQMAALEGPR